MPPTLTLERVESELEAIEAELCRRSLSMFVRRAWSIVEPDRAYVHNWHIDVLCSTLESITRGDLKRVIINIPPGTMKSLLVSVFWPAWEWANNPKLRYLSASYSTHLTIRDNLRLRDIVQSPWYQRHFAVTFASDQNAKELIKTTGGGWRFATSVGGAGTGEHPDRILIDDPHTAEQAASDKERKTATDWFDNTISTRGVARDVAIVLVMQRFEEEDLSGYLIAKGGWLLIRFPMRYEPTRPPNPATNDSGWDADPLDPRREDGELLWDELFTEPKVKQLETDLGIEGTAGQLQQRPTPRGGGEFKREWFKVIRYIPSSIHIQRRVRGWDTAGTEDGGDYTVGVLLAESEQECIYVEDVRREQLGPNGVDQLIKATAKEDGITLPQREEKEGGSAGGAVIAMRAKTLKGHDYRGVVVTGNKRVRRKPFRTQCEAGNVYLLWGPWNKAYIDELCNLPHGKYDDQGDASSCAYNALLLEPVIEPMSVVKLNGF